MRRPAIPPLRAALTALALAALALAAPVPAAAQRDPVSPADRWWKEGVIYQVYPRSFQDSNGDGVGDLAGITRRLDYLRWLGVDAIWISPFFPSPMRDFGYDVSDYTGVDPRFGTMRDFARLTRAAHRRGIHVILDFVGNHTSDRHPWFVAARASRAAPRRDWYVWRDPAPGGGPPNDWLSIFGGSAWTLDSATGQYYYHQFLREQPDLNWRNPAVRRAMFDAMRFWLDRGADGFRLDAIPHLVEDSLFRDNPPNPDWRPGEGDARRQIWRYTFDQPGTLDALCGMRRVVDAYARRDGRARVLVGETGVPLPRLMAYYGTSGCGAQLPTYFGLQGAPWNPDTLAARIGTYLDALAHAPGDSAARWPDWVLGNHDTHRLSTRLGPAAARAAAVLLLTLRGTPTIYYGDEIGMHDVPIPASMVQDPAERNEPGLGLGRDPERTPMQWRTGPGAGFTTGTPWLPVAADAGVRNVAAERGDTTSTLRLYHDLLALRRREPALARGTMRWLPRQGGVLAWTREDPAGSDFLVLVNVADSAAVWSAVGRVASDAGRAARGTTRPATIAAGTHRRRGTVSLGRVTLAPDEAVVIRLAAGGGAPATARRSGARGRAGP